MGREESADAYAIEVVRMLCHDSDGIAVRVLVSRLARDGFLRGYAVGWDSHASGEDETGDPSG